MAEKLNARTEKTPPPEAPAEDNLPLIPRAIVSISASLDTLAWIAEKWALKHGYITEADLKDE